MKQRAEILLWSKKILLVTGASSFLLLSSCGDPVGSDSDQSYEACVDALIRAGECESRVSCIRSERIFVEGGREHNFSIYGIKKENSDQVLMKFDSEFRPNKFGKPVVVRFFTEKKDETVNKIFSPHPMHTRRY